MPSTTTVTAAVTAAVTAVATTTEIESFIRRMGSVQMTELMLELCNDHEAVRKRLLRLMLADDPRRLAAGFRKSLMDWRRSDIYLGYSQTRDFGLELEEWLGQVELELLPVDPAAALELAETFIESDAHFFKRVDDSGGDVGDAIRAGCRLPVVAEGGSAVRIAQGNLAGPARNAGISRRVRGPGCLVPARD